MEIIHAAIVDDEPLGRPRIRELLEPEQDIEVVGEYDLRSASKPLRRTRPDLLFVDIPHRSPSLHDLRGLTAGRAPATIFVTSNEGLAVRAFDLGAIDYLVRPFDTARFRCSLERARAHLGLRPERRRSEPLARLAVRNREKILLLSMADVDWIEAADNYVSLHVGDRTHLYRDTLSNFETKLDPGRFVRIDRSTIVNVDRIVQLEPTFHREHVVLLRDGVRLRLTATHRHRLKALIGSF